MIKWLNTASGIVQNVYVCIHTWAFHKVIMIKKCIMVLTPRVILNSGNCTLLLYTSNQHPLQYSALVVVFRIILIPTFCAYISLSIYSLKQFRSEASRANVIAWLMRFYCSRPCGIFLINKTWSQVQMTILSKLISKKSWRILIYNKINF